MTELPINPESHAPGFHALPEEPLFRFGLRQVFLFTALLSVILAAVVLLQGVAGMMLLMAAWIVAAHVFSTALASRLRSRADEAQANSRNRDADTFEPGQRPTHLRGIAEIPIAVRSPWHSRGSTSLPWLRWLVVSGAAAGGGLGAAALAVTIGHRLTAAGVVVGGFSSAVLGGWFAFLGGSFYGILRHGIREAIVEQRKDERPSRLVP